MSCTRHLTFERSRERYVFQIRVPKDVASSFSGRTHVRVALGRVDESQAAKKAATLASEWAEKFEKARRRRAPSRITRKSPTSTVLILNDELMGRAVLTRRLVVLTRLYDTLAKIRGADDHAWDSAIAEAEAALTVARRKLTRGTTDEVWQVREDIKAAFSIELDLSDIDLNGFSDLVNADAVALAKGWLETLRGDATLDQLHPEITALLPMTRFFGTPAESLLNAWHGRLELVGKSARPKTVAKYQAIVDDLQAILGETPIEAIQPEHVRELSEVWRARGNGASTIVDKWTIVISLLRPVAPAAAELCRSMMPRTNLDRTRRLPFTAEQLGKVRAAVVAAESTTDDLMLCDLATLTGARLGELLQLRICDVTREKDRWAIEIGGYVDAILKTVTSRRQVPVSTRLNPELEAWLETRTAAAKCDELLFADAKADKFGHFGAAESKRLNRIIRTLHMDKRIVFESIRNTVARTLRADGVDPRVRRGLLGHADLDIHEKHYDPGVLLTIDDLMPALPSLDRLTANVLSTCAAASPTRDSL